MAVEIINIITSIVSSYGYLGLFIAAFAETIFPPIPSEVIFPLAGFVGFRSNFTYLETFLMAVSGAVGATIGAVLIYFISLKIGRIAIVKLGKYVFVSEEKIETAEKWFEKYGIYAVFLGRMAPGVRELISVPAGIARMPIVKFTIFTFLGSLVWSTVLVFSGYLLGNSWSELSDSLSDYFPLLSILTTAIFVSVVIFYLIRKKKKRKGSIDT
ncbi:Inner membrane protein YqjA [Candidatus Nitrosocosmicus franklandus]|uniref:Inner membrane protein YqjA n=1 Tax=Candidatus Nitrosocosmicus franklandianus TaxID=1798806 RepID=A0A484I4R1_9ARCH|nr:Inner membrane protein YqjA [Candidatus Nitrosocosmicus franklandus]